MRCRRCGRPAKGMRRRLVVMVMLVLLVHLAAQQAAVASTQSAVMLTDLGAGANFRRLAVWSGRARDLSGRYWDTSSFYNPTQGSYFLRMGLLFGALPDVLVNATAYVDTGLDAPAMDVDPFVSLSVAVILLPRDNLIVSVGVRDLVQMGGKVREYPCRDLFDGAFHCGTTLPWTDYVRAAPDFGTNRTFFGRIEYRF